MPLFDTHAHLHFPEFAADLDAVLERARAAGLVGMVTIGTDHETNPAAVALAERLPDVYATVGIHPHDAAEATEADFEALEALARSSAKVVAIGEMGLDFFRDLSPRDVQERVFRRQLGLARRLGRPVVVHCGASGGAARGGPRRARGRDDAQRRAPVSAVPWVSAG